jgi:cytochrome c556
MLPEGFPAGSYVKDKTAAKPAIWENRAEFDALLTKLANKSAALAEVAKGGDLAAIKPAFSELTQVCKSCHDKFREKDE